MFPICAVIFFSLVQILVQILVHILFQNEGGLAPDVQTWKVRGAGVGRQWRVGRQVVVGRQSRVGRQSVVGRQVVVSAVLFFAPPM